MQQTGIRHTFTSLTRILQKSLLFAPGRYKIERIHPFQDGNGRVGRLVALKECLHYNIVPFIIEDSKKEYYYRGLSEWARHKCNIPGAGRQQACRTVPVSE